MTISSRLSPSPFSIGRSQTPWERFNEKAKIYMYAFPTGLRGGRVMTSDGIGSRFSFGLSLGGKVEDDSSLTADFVLPSGQYLSIALDVRRGESAQSVSARLAAELKRQAPPGCEVTLKQSPYESKVTLGIKAADIP